MINRAQPPKIREIESVPLPEYQKIELDNGIPLFLIEAGTQPVLKLEVVFQAGRPYESHRLVSRATARMLKEGTKSFTAAQIAEQTDYFGSSITIPVNLDTSGMTFYSLSKHLEKLLPMWTEILTAPKFDPIELAKLKQNNIERLKIDLSKNDVIAYRNITEHLFGANHPYGYNSVKETYEELQIEWLQEHFQKQYIAENCMLFLSGRPEKNATDLINKTLGTIIPNGVVCSPNFPRFTEKTSRTEISNPGSPQTALRMGRILFPRSHPDYADFFVLNTILGGYFGSRLMTNLREDKGFTYNIYTSLDAMHKEGAFLIGAELSHDHRAAAEKEIKKELNRLINEPIASEELEMVRSYLMGSFLSMVDGPFNIGEIVRTAEVEHLGKNYFKNLVDAVKNANPSTIQQMAQKYLDPSRMSLVLVGD